MFIERNVNYHVCFAGIVVNEREAKNVFRN